MFLHGITEPITFFSKKPPDSDSLSGVAISGERGVWRRLSANNRATRQPHPFNDLWPGPRQGGADEEERHLHVQAVGEPPDGKKVGEEAPALGLGRRG